MTAVSAQRARGVEVSWQRACLCAEGVSWQRVCLCTEGEQQHARTQSQREATTGKNISQHNKTTLQEEHTINTSMYERQTRRPRPSARQTVNQPSRWMRTQRTGASTACPDQPLPSPLPSSYHYCQLPSLLLCSPCLLSHATRSLLR